MTQKFLDTFFQGKWHNYGHWSACLIMCLAAGMVLPWWAAGFIGFGTMAVWEAIQWRIDSGWTWSDVLYNGFGVAAYLVINIVSHYIHIYVF